VRTDSSVFQNRYCASAQTVSGNFMKTLIMIFCATVLSFHCFAQSKSTDKKLTDTIATFDFLNITIRHFVERYERTEVNIIYHQDNKMKIHSILKSNVATELQIDTTFILSDAQLMLIDKFGEDFKNNKIEPREITFAGTRTFYYITLDGKTVTLDNKRGGYSLILDLLDK
jgi:hypothetical protein